METSDATLLQKWQQSSDSEAFTIIVARHSAMVFATCNRILRNNADSEDVTQECFMELDGVRKLVGNSLGGLLHTLATHRSLDRLKRESRRREREIRYAMGRPISCTVVWDDIYPHIDEAIANLPMKYRDAIIRHFLEGQTHAEISSAMAVAESTVRYRITKGIERVRTELRRRGVIVSADAMGNVLGESHAEAVSADLAANLGKLAVAGAGTGTSTRNTTLAGGRLTMKKVLEITAVVALAGLAGLVAWNLNTQSPPPEPDPSQATNTPALESPETGDTVPNHDVIALDDQSHAPIPATTTDPAASIPPVESPVVEESGSDAASTSSDTPLNQPMPETGPITVASAMEPLRFELPEAFFGGTPLDYWGPNLEEEDYKDRPPFLAPGGTANISVGKPVTASSEPTVGTLTQVTDGDKDYAKSSLIELPEGLQWVQIDLEKASEIYAVLVWHFHEGKRVYFDLVVQVSDDPQFKTGVTTIYNNDFDNSAGLGVGEDKEYIESNKGRLIDAKGATGRYLRVYGKGSTASDFNHFIEVEVWGK